MLKELERKWCGLLGIPSQHLLESDTEFRARVKAPLVRRECVREEPFEILGQYLCPGSDARVRLARGWTYHYSDGTTETVTVRERQP